MVISPTIITIKTLSLILLSFCLAESTVAPDHQLLITHIDEHSWRQRYLDDISCSNDSSAWFITKEKSFDENASPIWRLVMFYDGDKKNTFSDTSSCTPVVDKRVTVHHHECAIHGVPIYVTRRQWLWCMSWEISTARKSQIKEKDGMRRGGRETNREQSQPWQTGDGK